MSAIWLKSLLPFHPQLAALRPRAGHPFVRLVAVALELKPLFPRVRIGSAFRARYRRHPVGSVNRPHRERLAGRPKSVSLQVLHSFFAIPLAGLGNFKTYPLPKRNGENSLGHSHWHELENMSKLRISNQPKESNRRLHEPFVI